VLAAPLKIWQGGKYAPRIISCHANVIFLWVAPQPPCHRLKDPEYAMDKRVKPAVGSRMAEQKGTKKRIVKVVLQNIFSTHFFLPILNHAEQALS